MYDNGYFSHQGDLAMQNRYFNAEGEGNFYGAEFYGAAGEAPAMVSPLTPSLPFAIQVQNTSTSTNRTATIWDAANSLASGTAANYGNNADLVFSIVEGQWTYPQLLQLATGNSFRIAAVDIEGTTPTTVASNACTITEFELPGGKKTINTYSPPINKFQQQNQCRSLNVPFTINALASFAQQVNANSTLIYRFYPNAVINPSRGVAGQQPTVLFAAPQTQGLQVIGSTNTMPAHPAMMLGR